MTIPMLDISLFRNRSFSADSITLTLLFFAMAGTVFLQAQYLQFILGYTPLAAGFALVPAAVGILLGTGAGAHLAEMHGGRVAVAAGTLIAAGGVAVQAAFADGGSYLPTGVGLLLFGLGAGIAMPAATEMIMATLPPARAGVGSAVNDTVREFGGALGVAVIGSIAATGYTSSMRGELGSLLRRRSHRPHHDHRQRRCGDRDQSTPRRTGRPDRHSCPHCLRGLDEPVAVDRRRPRSLRRHRRPHPAAPPISPRHKWRPGPPWPHHPDITPRPRSSRARDDVMNTDIVVIGGGAAGLTAGLVLARARRRVTLIDDQTYRNATVDEFHGFPTRDATAPNRFRTDAVRELSSYGVAFVGSTVTCVNATDRTVRVELDDGTAIDASTMLLATGVQDELPPIKGLAQRWGKSVFNCPFCDGWEQRDQPVVVIDAVPGADHLADMLRSWSPDVTIVNVDDVAALTGTTTTLDHVVLRDGRAIPATAAFLKARVVPRSSFARQAGCDIDAAGYVITDDNGATSHPLVWAAGDLRRPPPAPHQVVLAAADGSTAAIAMHKSLVARNIHATQRRTIASGRARR